jgi:hypothetical protein
MKMNLITVIASALNELVRQLISLVPQLLVALIIWWLGGWLLNMGEMLLRKINIPKTKLDDKAIDVVVRVAMPVGKVMLVLIILDYLGIGRSVISALATGVTLTIAIALGLAFGKALEPQARDVVNEVSKYFKKG